MIYVTVIVDRKSTGTRGLPFILMSIAIPCISRGPHLPNTILMNKRLFETPLAFQAYPKVINSERCSYYDSCAQQEEKITRPH